MLFAQSFQTENPLTSLLSQTIPILAIRKNVCRFCVRHATISRLNPYRPGRTDRTCSHCGMRSPLIFSVGWGCLTSTCLRFWTLPEMEFMSFPDELEFHENFLQLQTLSPLDEGFRNICPPPPVTSPSDKITTVQSFTRGMHCVKCGRLSCR